MRNCSRTRIRSSHSGSEQLTARGGFLGEGGDRHFSSESAQVEGLVDGRLEGRSRRSELRLIGRRPRRTPRRQQTRTATQILSCLDQDDGWHGGRHGGTARSEDWHGSGHGTRTAHCLCREVLIVQCGFCACDRGARAGSSVHQHYGIQDRGTVRHIRREGVRKGRRWQHRQVKKPCKA